MRTGGSASSKMTRSSGTASRQFNGTATAPILLAAKRSSITSGALRSMYAMRDPSPTPAARSACASRFDRSSSSRVGDGAVAMTNGHVTRPHRGVLTHDIGDPKLIPRSHARTCPRQRGVLGSALIGFPRSRRRSSMPTTPLPSAQESSGREGHRPDHGHDRRAGPLGRSRATGTSRSWPPDQPPPRPPFS